MKIAVINGGNLCQGGLEYMSREFSQALCQLGHDSSTIEFSNPNIITDLFCDNSYDAIVGLQHSCFTQLLSTGYLADISDVPKFNILFDSPSWARFLFRQSVKHVNYLYHDEKYTDFVKSHYPDISVFHLPLGGSMGKLARAYTDNGITEFNPDHLLNRKYDVTFIGTYSDYRLLLEENSDDTNRNLIKLYFNKIISNPNLPAQQCFFELMNELEIDIPTDKLLDILSMIFPAERAAFSYYREKTIEVLLDSGIKIEVFSPSWSHAPFAGHPNLIIHQEIPYTDALDIMAQSKLSLNVFSWHKGGMTERISNIMLNGAVCVTDSSSYISEHFKNDNDILMFNLTDPDEASKRIKELLSNEAKRINIALNGYRVATKSYQWINCAERFITILNSILL